MADNDQCENISGRPHVFCACTEAQSLNNEHTGYHKVSTSLVLDLCVIWNVCVCVLVSVCVIENKDV